MKNLILTFVSLLVLFVLGCEENSITDPFSVESIKKDQFSDTIYHQGVIDIEGILSDPRPIGNSYFLISGQLEYEYWFINGDDVQNMPQNTVSVNLLICAELTNFCSTCPPRSFEALDGYLNCEASDIISFTGSILTLQKSFPVQCEDEFNLKCKFSISMSGLELESMWLELSGHQSSGNLSD